ncbi:hypothetical protein C9I47_3154 [Lysobacter maris]|uniref:Uncharacterized protein n=2 Tax=Marilutibacter maris TaxID=1605891 RepID=A0A2U9TEA6_9GAMM|nr:hypothetical protein C9I47_3154 [Lysobacter maris]
MALDDLFDLGDLLLQWRLYLGLAITFGVCWGIYTLIPEEPVCWILIVPVGLVGLWLSLKWEHRASLGR